MLDSETRKGNPSNHLTSFSFLEIRDPLGFQTHASNPKSEIMEKKKDLIDYTKEEYPLKAKDDRQKR